MAARHGSEVKKKREGPGAHRHRAGRWRGQEGDHGRGGVIAWALVDRLPQSMLATSRSETAR